MSFTDQKPRIVTEEEIKGFKKAGRRFACYLCGRRFEVGDVWRWVYSSCRTVKIDGKRWGLINFQVCKACDGEDVLDRWVAANEEADRRFFWLKDE